MQPDDLTPMQRIAYDLVAEIIDTKQGSTEPCMAHINEIRNSLNIEILEALRELCRKGVLQFHIDINKSPMFNISQQLEP